VSLEIAKIAVEVSQDKKAENIHLFDLRGKSDISSYQLVCSAASDRQTRAIAEGIADTCKQRLGFIPSCVEGMQDGNWILLDYGAVIVHVFVDATRTQFNLEKLFLERNAAEVSLAAL
jgi:ribosome-associated protein